MSWRLTISFQQIIQNDCNSVAFVMYSFFLFNLQMLNVTLATYNALCYLLINITYTTLTAYITLHYPTLPYTTLLAYIHRLQFMT